MANKYIKKLLRTHSYISKRAGREAQPKLRGYLEVEMANGRVVVRIHELLDVKLL